MSNEKNRFFFALVFLSSICYAEQITFFDSDTASCGGIAEAKVLCNGELTTGVKFELGYCSHSNTTLSQNPPHNGNGGGKVSVYVKRVIIQSDSDPDGYIDVAESGCYKPTDPNYNKACGNHVE